MQVPSNQIKVAFIIYFTLQLGTFVSFSCFTYVAPPSQIIRGAAPPAPPPSSYAYDAAFIKYPNLRININPETVNAYVSTDSLFSKSITISTINMGLDFSRISICPISRCNYFHQFISRNGGIKEGNDKILAIKSI